MRTPGSTRPTRRAVLPLIGGALAAPLTSRFARAAETVWKVAHTAPPEFPLHLRLVEAAAMVAEQSNGRMELRILGSSEAGNQAGIMAQLRAGRIDVMPITGMQLSESFAPAALPLVGFAWSGYDVLWRAMDGELGDLLREVMVQRSGLVPMARVWDFGFRVITTADKPLRSAADLQGLRIRTPVEADLVNLLKSLKASPIGMPLTAVYDALRRGEIDGQEGLVPLIAATGFNQVQRACTLTNHVWDGHWICVSGASWKGLPDRLKTVVGEAFDKAGLSQRADTVAVERRVRDALTADGMSFATVAPDSFRETLRQTGYYRDLRTRFGERYWSALEKAAGRLV